MMTHNYNQSVQLSVGTELQFPDFSVTYLGESQVQSPSTATVMMRKYQIKSKANVIQEIIVTHGQTPPRDEVFTVGGKKFELLTLKSPSGESLFPNRFMIKRP